LDFVGHGIRTQLDEIKRKEVDRLRQIIRLQSKLKHGIQDDDDGDDDVRRGIVRLLAFFVFFIVFLSVQLSVYSIC